MTAPPREVCNGMCAVGSLDPNCPIHGAYAAPAPPVAQPAERPMLQCWSCGGWYATTVGHDCASASIPPERATHESVHTRRIYGADRTEPPAAQPAEPVPNRTWQIMLMAAASRSGNPSVIELAAQLVGAQPCKGCGFVNYACRCATPPVAQPAEPPATDAGITNDFASLECVLQDANEAALDKDALIERQAREIADYKVELSRLQSERDENRELFNKEYNEARESRRRLRDELSGERDRHKRTQERAEHAEAERDALQIRYDKLKRVQDATIAEFEQAVGSLPEAKQLRAERDALRECVREITRHAAPIYATSADESVRKGYEVGGYIKWYTIPRHIFDAARAKVSTKKDSP